MLSPSLSSQSSHLFFGLLLSLHTLVTRDEGRFCHPRSRSCGGEPCSYLYRVQRVSLYHLVSPCWSFFCRRPVAHIISRRPAVSPVYRHVLNCADRIHTDVHRPERRHSCPRLPDWVRKAPILSHRSQQLDLTLLYSLSDGKPAHTPPSALPCPTTGRQAVSGYAHTAPKVL